MTYSQIHSHFVRRFSLRSNNHPKGWGFSRRSLNLKQSENVIGTVNKMVKDHRTMFASVLNNLNLLELTRFSESFNVASAKREIPVGIQLEHIPYTEVKGSSNKDIIVLTDGGV